MSAHVRCSKGSFEATVTKAFFALWATAAKDATPNEGKVTINDLPRPILIQIYRVILHNNFIHGSIGL